jgi:hypothetical protein
VSHLYTVHSRRCRSFITELTVLGNTFSASAIIDMACSRKLRGCIPFAEAARGTDRSTAPGTAAPAPRPHPGSTAARGPAGGRARGSVGRTRSSGGRSAGAWVHGIFLPPRIARRLGAYVKRRFLIFLSLPLINIVSYQQNLINRGYKN